MPEVIAPPCEPRVNHAPTGFPHKMRGGILQFFRMQPVGWQDLGKVGTYYRNGESGFFKICGLCAVRLHIAKQDEEVFLFCPHCLKKRPQK